VLELPVPAFEFAGFGTALGAFKIEAGKSATQIIGLETGRVLANGDTVGAIGDATPDFQMSFSTDLNWKQWSFGMLWDWKKGGDVINLTELLFDLFGNSADWNTPGGGRDRFLAFVDPISANTVQYVQDASYLKMREVSLAYQLSPSATRQLFGSLVKGARLSVSGRNLIRITDFRGIDPEVSNFGNQAIGRNFDVAPFPSSRSFFISIDLDF
ncbi:MAG: SusC/RagA family TonB-linked outer membrane protein, partial [Gemmatimonadales bacterium]